MKTTKLLLTSAVATALFPIASFAAIDDQGMQYVTAAEGLHGSLRVHILHNEEIDADANFRKNATETLADSDVSKGGAKESLRLWITGSGDIGNGWATTYYWEVRDGSGGAKDGTIGTEAWDVGLRGSIGSVNFGRLGMVAPRMVPGGSLDTVAGGNAEHFASDVGDNGLRFESAVFNGFQIGISGTARGDEADATWVQTSEDDLFDEYSLAVKYVSPLGFQVGAGYEVELLHNERYGTAATAADYDDKSGWRVGARYGQDNWLVGYEFRTYDGLSPWETNLNFANRVNPLNPLSTPFNDDWYDNTGIAAIEAGTDSTAVNNMITAGTIVRRRPDSSKVIDARTEFNSRINYQVHRMGVQVKLDKITASAGYSLETQKLAVTGAVDIDRTALAVDAAYHLGRNSLLAVGWKQVNTEQWARGVPNATNGFVRGGFTRIVAIGKTIKSKATTTQLYYRVDF